MSVARLATFDHAPHLREDDSRRAQSLYELLRSLPGFRGRLPPPGVVYRELMSFTVWDSERSLEAAQRAVDARPIGDRRGIRPSRVERWTVEAGF